MDSFLDANQSFIQVGFRQASTDALGEKMKKDAFEDLGTTGIQDVKTAKMYSIDFALSNEQLEQVTSKILADPVNETYSINTQLEIPDGFDWMIRVGFKPGVTDNEGKTALLAIKDLLKIEADKKSKVYTSTLYMLKTKDMKEKDIENIASNLLANKLIQYIKVTDLKDWDKKSGLEYMPRAGSNDPVLAKEINLQVSDSQLTDISRKGTLSLNLKEMKLIADHFTDPAVFEERSKLGLGKNPTDVELEVLAQTWSEHCKHKIFNANVEYTGPDGKTQEINSIFNTYIKKSTDIIGSEKDFLVSVFSDNAGIVKFDDTYNIAMKVETHNSPSAKDPYGGAITGVNGCHRDIMGVGIGAKLIGTTDVLCFADPFYDKPLPPGNKVLHPRRIMKGVMKGIEDAGNKTGVPTVNGAMIFDNCFLGKPLVYCGTLGLISKTVAGKPSEDKSINVGDKIVMVGGKIGKDGIHGATFSSETLTEASPSSAVQIGDPITQKKAYDFLLKARDLGLYNAITDNGAGGLSSSVGEIAEISGGCIFHLDRAPLKYEGLQPWEILISESQERMTVSVPVEKLDEFTALAKEHEVEATVLGEFNASGKMHALYDGKTVSLLDMEFLHNGVPKMHLKARWQPTKRGEPADALETDFGTALKKLLSALNICSKEKFVRPLDHEVQGGSVGKPFVGVENDGPADAAVLRPVLDSFEGIIVSNGIIPQYSLIDTYHMSANAIDEAIRGVIAVGGDLDEIAFNDNFCWPSPLEDEKKMGDLVRANQALFDYTVAFGTPCISGKDSMTIDTVFSDENGNLQKVSGIPTLLISAMAKMKDVRLAVTMDAKVEGDLVYVIGKTKNELGASEYYKMHGLVGDNVPRVDAQTAKKLYNALSDATSKSLVASLHDCSQGGLAVTLAETAFSGGLGIESDLAMVPAASFLTDEQVLFSESAGRFVATVDPKNRYEFEDALAGNCFACIGRVVETPVLKVKGLNGNDAICESLSDLKRAWQSTLGAV